MIPGQDVALAGVRMALDPAAASGYGLPILGTSSHNARTIQGDRAAIVMSVALVPWGASDRRSFVVHTSMGCLPPTRPLYRSSKGVHHDESRV